MNNHRTEMGMKDIFERSTVRKKVLNSGGVRIPAITSMKLRLGEVNEMLKDLGLTRRMPTEFEFRPHEGESLNRYMEYQLRRMEKYRDNGESRKYGFLATSLIRNSVSFRVAGFRKVFPKGYKDMPLKYVFSILRKVDKITKNGVDDLEYKRVYIPKANGKLRPLGVPTHAWRVVLHMHSAFLSHFLEKRIGKNQHAYRTGMGTLSAWKDLLIKVHQYRFIYEIDLKNCFNEINSAGVSEKLKELGVPPRYFYYLENLNRNVPVFTAKDEIDESVLRDRKEMHRLARLGMPLKETSIYDTYNEMTPEDQLVVKQMAFEEGMTLDEFIQLQGALLDEYGPTSIGNSHRGLPQGSALSPILTTLVLDEFTRQTKDSTFYADDGIFMDNKDFDIKSDPDKGILLSPDKCKGLKRNGKGLHPVVFLGMKGGRNKLSGHTRNGSRLEVGGNLDKLFRFLKVFKPEYSNIAGVFNNTSLGGLVQSKLYSGNGNGEFYESKLTFTGVRNSGLRLKGKRDNYVTTTSDASYALAQILRSRKFNFVKPASKRKVPRYVFGRRYKK